MAQEFLFLEYRCVVSTVAAKKATKKSQPLKFKVGLGKVIRGVRLLILCYLYVWFLCGLCYWYTWTLHCVSKNIPSIFSCNFKKSYQIDIISGVNILDKTCHQMTAQLSNWLSICFCTTKGMQTKQNICWNMQKCGKNISDIIANDLKKHYQILIIFGRNISDTTGYWVTV